MLIPWFEWGWRWVCLTKHDFEWEWWKKDEEEEVEADAWIDGCRSSSTSPSVMMTKLLLADDEDFEGVTQDVLSGEKVLETVLWDSCRSWWFSWWFSSWWWWKRRFDGDGMECDDDLIMIPSVASSRCWCCSLFSFWFRWWSWFQMRLISFLSDLESVKSWGHKGSAGVGCCWWWWRWWLMPEMKRGGKDVSKRDSVWYVKMRMSGGWRGEDVFVRLTILILSSLLLSLLLCIRSTKRMRIK